jgi:hypothetical protein
VVQATTGDLERGKVNFLQVMAFRDRVAGDGRTFLLLIFPELIDFDRYPYQGIVDALDDFCRGEGIAAVNLLPALAEHDAADLWAHETDHHPNQLAHRIACEQLLPALPLD